MNEIAEAPATAYETRAYFLDRSKRTFAPVRWSFVQQPRGSEVRRSVLSTFVRNGDRRGLLSYLFILGITSSQQEEGWVTTLDSRVWARCLGTTEDTSSPAAALGAVGKVLGRLEDRKLIEAERKGRTDISVFLRREDGSGATYTRPGKPDADLEQESEEERARDPYLQFPHDFWRSRTHDQIKLPGLAMLLVLMCEPAWTSLPTARMPSWYGWSADTAERGFKELRELGLLSSRERIRKAPAAPLGYTKFCEYKLALPYRQAPGKGGKPRQPAADPSGGGGETQE
ncbi:hypothetical protein [Microbispora sp. NPDC049125]|uniref:hypothetical protein n=1 Tax=Microbispora sp. NPDC049125 TaxID=3154929 RepID=UPI0034652218